ncbi:phenylacetate--CoA ligase family protein [Candidatus Woesearchaeota archaeon]|nr:phenylacetate--CoA ligase family protein [Candidatus Woesearchaeota archaeon]
MKQIIRIIEEIALNLFFLLENDFRMIYFYQYCRNLRKNRDEIKQLQDKKLKKLIEHAYSTCPYYKKAFDDAKISPKCINSSEDLKKIPNITKADVNKNKKQMISQKYNIRKLTKDFSGGTTGEGVQFYKDKRYMQKARAVWMRDIYAHGYRPGDKMAWIWGSERETKDSSKIMKRIRRILTRKIWFNPTNFEEETFYQWIIEEYNMFKPKFIYGYENAILSMARLIEKRGIKIHKPQKVFSTSESLNNRDYLEKVFGCEVIDQYGCREVLALAIEDKNKIMRSDDDFVIIEVNEKNEILLTPLEAYGMPLIRYRVGDLGIRKKSQKSNKHPFNSFDLTLARTFEMFKTSNNTTIYSGEIIHQASKKKVDVGEYQLVQNSTNLITINIIGKKKDVKPEEIDKLKKVITKLSGIIDVRVKFLNKRLIAKSGKIIAAKCLIESREK